MLIAERLRLDVGRGNALFDQEVLCAGNTPFGECLVIRRASTLVGMAFQRNLCIRLVLQIGFEVRSELRKRLLLARFQTAIGILRAWLGLRREVNAATNRQPRFEARSAAQPSTS